MPRFILTFSLLLTACLISIAGAQIHPPDPAIVSAWKLEGKKSVLILRHDGVYIHISDDLYESGFERGNFVWDKTNSLFYATASVDTNGNEGLTYPTGTFDSVLSGNSLTLSRGDTTPVLQYTRIVPANQSIVGAWHAVDTRAGYIFLEDGGYYAFSEIPAGPTNHDGIERGTYTWNPDTGALGVTVMTDTNGSSGLSGLGANPIATVTGNSLTLPNHGQPLRRFGYTPISLPDFTVLKGIYHTQKNANGPVVEAFIPDTRAYYAGAEILSHVGPTSPSLKTGTRSPRNFTMIPELPGYFYLENDYTSLTNLNATSAYPNDTNFEFRSGTATATVKFPAGTTIPAAPSIVTDRGSWSGNVYQLPPSDVIRWANRANHDPTKDFTILHVFTEFGGADIVTRLILTGDINSFDFGRRLSPSETYGMILSHVRMEDTTTSGTGVFSGFRGSAMVESTTYLRFKMAAPTTSSITITRDPVSQSAKAGQDVTLSVEIADTHPRPQYQWYKGNHALSGQTGSSLTLPNIRQNDTGAYSVRIFRDFTSVTSRAADITLSGAETSFISFIMGHGMDPGAEGAGHLDPDGDGIPNAIECLMGGNPKVPDRQWKPTMSVTRNNTTGNQELTYVFLLRSDLYGLPYAVEHADSPAGPWVEAAHGYDGVTIGVIRAGMNTDRFTVKIPVTGGRRFIRIRAFP